MIVIILNYLYKQVPKVKQYFCLLKKNSTQYFVIDLNAIKTNEPCKTRRSVYVFVQKRTELF